MAFYCYRVHHLVWFVRETTGGERYVIRCAHCDYTPEWIEDEILWADDGAQERCEQARAAHQLSCPGQSRQVTSDNCHSPKSIKSLQSHAALHAVTSTLPTV